MFFLDGDTVAVACLLSIELLHWLDRKLWCSVECRLGCTKTPPVPFCTSLWFWYKGCGLTLESGLYIREELISL